MPLDRERPLAPNVKEGDGFKPSRKISATGFITTRRDEKRIWVQYEDNGTKVVIYHEPEDCPENKVNLETCSMITWTEYNGVL